MSNKMRTGDQVVVIAGNDRGKFGKIISRSGDKVIIEGVNVRKKHLKKSQANPKGQIIDLERPIHISNVKVAVDGSRPVKLKVRTNQTGEREYYYQDGDKQQLYRAVKKPK